MNARLIALVENLCRAPTLAVLNFRLCITAGLILGFVVLTAVIMKSTIFWDATPCDPLNFN
jgi:hypothetical protein